MHTELSDARRGACLISALICVCLGFTWEALTVHYNDKGNWTALFVSGSMFPVPPALASENVYVLPNSGGYDGQMYHYVAHDPLLRHGFQKFVDSAQLRYRRILLPGLAFLLAGGQQGAIDRSYIGVNLLFLFLGAWWLARYFVLLGLNPAFAILFVIMPAPLISLDRLTVDLSLTALAMGFAYYWRVESLWKLYIVILLAGLSRETGLVLTGAICISWLLRGRFVRAVLFSTAALPMLLWYLYVNSRTDKIFGTWFALPLSGVWDILAHPVRYPFSPLVNGVIMTLDYLLMVGTVMGCILAIRMLTKNPTGAVEIACALWTAMALCFVRGFWIDCYGSGRVLTAMFIFLGLFGGAKSSMICWAPLLLVSMRVWLQLLSPGLSVIKGIFHVGR